MITSLLLSFIATILLWAFSFLPTVSTMPEWYTPVKESMYVFASLGDLPLIGTLIQVIMLVLAFLGGWQVVVFSNWLYNKIRGSG